MNSMMPIVTSESDPISAFSPYIDRGDEVNGRRRPPSLPHNRAESSLVLGERCDMRPLTGFAHALICQRVALPSFSVLAHGASM